MATIVVKDANLTDREYNVDGAGTSAIPYRNITADFYAEVRKGNVPKHSIVQKFGAVDNVTTAITPVTTSKTYQTPTAPVALELVSTDNTNDVAGGSGARSITLEGLSNTNGAWTFESQTVALNGTTAVAVPNSMLRVYRMYVASSGSYAAAGTPSHNSTITLQVASAGAAWGVITSESSFGLGQSEIAVYSVAAGETAYMLNKSIAIEGTKSANVFLFVREGADTVAAPFTPMRVKEVERNLDQLQARKGNAPLVKVVGPADVGFMAQSTSTTTDVSIDFELLIVED